VHAAFYGTAADGKTFYHGHTYSGNPLGAAVALANLQVFDDEATLEAIAPKADVLRRSLARLSALRHVGDVRQCGLIAGVELVADKATKASFPWEDQMGARVCRLAREFGVLIRPLGDVVVVMPPLSIREAQLLAMLDAIERAIQSVTEEEGAR
jgi:adenosylmethionine-8-amino-7-oxononanoate aminotransferase